MPSIVKNPNFDIKKFHICTKGNRHAQQPLNLVCLDPICRQSPLICSTCFSELHKYHKTITLSEFLSDYQGSIHRNHKNSVMKRLNKQHQNVIKSVTVFKFSINQKLNQYEQSLEEYFRYLKNSLDIRQNLQRTLNINLEPQKIIQSQSQKEIQDSLSFIINHSLFNQQNRLFNVSNILKCDQSRTLALLDKVVNQNLKIQNGIQEQMKKLTFASQTLKKQSTRIQTLVKNFNKTKHPQSSSQIKINYDPKAFIQKQTFYTTLNNFNISDHKTHLLQKVHDYFSLEQKQKVPYYDQKLLFVFSNVQKHDKLTILDGQKQSTIRSNVTALKPQYAIICPSVDYRPQKEQNWSIKINKCRNFASSKNTIAVGLCFLDEIKNQNFQQRGNDSLVGKYLITSQGFLIKNGREERCELTFTAGDVLDLKYDPYYRLLTIKKENGRKVSMKIKELGNDSNKLFACVRLTYASDQVQLLNHAKGSHN